MIRERETNIEGYPGRIAINHLTEKQPGEKVVVVGRIQAVRKHKNVIFADLTDQTGIIQLTLTNSEGESEQQLDNIKMGNIVAIDGVYGQSKTGESSVVVDVCELIAECAQPIPDKYHGLNNPKERFQNRHIDMISNLEIRDYLAQSSILKTGLRLGLLKHSFLEFETGVLQSKFEAGLAKPFVTHFNALNKDFYLRLTSELRLKMLMIGGLERVYELGQSFRNEGISAIHNPEFTLLEAYAAYTSYEDMMTVLQEIINESVVMAYGSSKVEADSGTINFSTPWARIDCFKAIREVIGTNLSPEMSKNELVDALSDHENFDNDMSLAAIYTKLYSKYLAHSIIQPTFVTGLASNLSPFIMPEDQNKSISQNSWLIIDGMIVGDFYTDENDPNLLRAAFETQANESVGEVNHKFLDALQYGIPPSSGVGLGVDRLLLSLRPVGVRKNIKEAIVFPNI